MTVSGCGSAPLRRRRYPRRPRPDPSQAPARDVTPARPRLAALRPESRTSGQSAARPPDARRREQTMRRAPRLQLFRAGRPVSARAGRPISARGRALKKEGPARRGCQLEGSSAHGKHAS